MLEQLKEWDREIFIYLNGLGIERFDSFWIFVTQEENWIPLYLFMIFLLLKSHRQNARNAIIVVCGFLLSFLVTFGFTRFVKEWVARIRPNNNETLKSIIRILQEPTYYSFFSGHAASSMAITTYVVLMLRKKYNWIYIFYLWPLLFAFSRIYVGVHYPSDIFVGALVGTCFAFIFYRITLHFIQEKIR